MGKLNSLIKLIVINANGFLALGGLGTIFVASVILSSDLVRLNKGYLRPRLIFMLCSGVLVLCMAIIGCVGTARQTLRNVTWGGRRLLSLFQLILLSVASGQGLVLLLLHRIEVSLRETAEDLPDYYGQFEGRFRSGFNEAFFDQQCSSRTGGAGWIWDLVEAHCTGKLSDESCQCLASGIVLPVCASPITYSPEGCCPDAELCEAGEDMACPYTTCREQVLEVILDYITPARVYSMVGLMLEAVTAILSCLLICYNPRDTTEDILIKSGTIIRSDDGKGYGLTSVVATAMTRSGRFDVIGNAASAPHPTLPPKQTTMSTGQVTGGEKPPATPHRQCTPRKHPTLRSPPSPRLTSEGGDRVPGSPRGHAPGSPRGRVTASPQGRNAHGAGTSSPESKSSGSRDVEGFKLAGTWHGSPGKAMDGRGEVGSVASGALSASTAPGTPKVERSSTAAGSCESRSPGPAQVGGKIKRALKPNNCAEEAEKGGAMSASRRRTEISGYDSCDGGETGMSGRSSTEGVPEEVRNSRPNLVEEREAHAEKAGEGDRTSESAGILESFGQTTGDSEMAGKGGRSGLSRRSHPAERGETGASGLDQLLEEVHNAEELFFLEEGVGEEEEISEDHEETGGSEVTERANQEQTEDRI